MPEEIIFVEGMPFVFPNYHNRFCWSHSAGGALLLMLPISTTNGRVTPFNETLFTATSAVCVTGLAVQDTGSYWSGFGQTIILVLIQIGGLGVVTVTHRSLCCQGEKSP